MFESLSDDHRLLLLQFVCAFAWADLHVTPKERAFVERLVERLELSEAEQMKVAGWLDVAPSPQDVDPSRVPAEHRRIFIETVRAVVYADGHVDPDERDGFEALRKALG